MDLQKQRCQSCGMPLGTGFYGTNEDGTENQEYCKFCFQNGSFTKPNITVEEMEKMSVDNMIQDLKMPVEKAQQLAQSVIPNLRRWKK